MKKRMFLAVLIGMLCAYPAGVFAQGIEKGDQMVSVFLGGAVNDGAKRRSFYR